MKVSERQLMVVDEEINAKKEEMKMLDTDILNR